MKKSFLPFFHLKSKISLLSNGPFEACCETRETCAICHRANFQVHYIFGLPILPSLANFFSSHAKEIKRKKRILRLETARKGWRLRKKKANLSCKNYNGCAWIWFSNQQPSTKSKDNDKKQRQTQIESSAIHPERSWTRSTPAPELELTRFNGLAVLEQNLNTKHNTTWTALAWTPASSFLFAIEKIHTYKPTQYTCFVLASSLFVNLGSLWARNSCVVLAGRWMNSRSLGRLVLIWARPAS